jgi:hypothetical protein
MRSVVRVTDEAPEPPHRLSSSVDTLGTITTKPHAAIDDHRNLSALRHNLSEAF